MDEKQYVALLQFTYLTQFYFFFFMIKKESEANKKKNKVSYIVTFGSL